MSINQFKLPLSFDPVLLEQDWQTLKDHNRQPQPGPFHKGEWTGIALCSAGGREDAAPSFPNLEGYRLTEVTKLTPYYKRILEDLPFPLQVVRLLALPPGGVVKEHVDFFANFQFGLIRLHIPIVTDPGVEFLIEGERCVWRVGDFWYGDFSKPHSVHNHSDVLRIHMVLDCEISPQLLEMFPSDYIEEQRQSGIVLASAEERALVTDGASFACSVSIPGPVVPLLIHGKLQDNLKGCVAHIRAEKGRMLVSVNGEDKFALRRIGENRFGFVGLCNGCYLEFDLDARGAVSAVTFVIKGVQADLLHARMGMVKGPRVAEQRIPLGMMN